MFTVEKSSNTDFGAMMITIELTWIVLLHCGLGHRSWRGYFVSSLQLHGVDRVTWDLLLHMRT